MDVSVFGTGYVGLIQAAALADVGHRVLCVDIDPNKIRRLQQAVPTISEPGLSGLLEDNIKAGRLLFSAQASDAVNHGELIFVAVGTPADEDGSADLSHVLAVTRHIADYMDSDRTLIIKSTVPVGTADKVAECARQVLERRGVKKLTVVDALVICTKWKNFRVVDLDLLANKLRARVIIDSRNLYNPEHIAAAGLLYRGIGLRHTVPSTPAPGPQA